MFIGNISRINAQCEICFSLKEANKNPLMVKSLDLSNEKIELVLKDLEKFQNLEELDLSNNLISEFRLDLSKLTKLHTLDLSSNPGLNLYDFPQTFYFSSLKNLNLSNCYINSLPPEIENLAQLNYLNLSDNKLKYIPQSIEKIKDLRELNVSTNNLSEHNTFLSNLWNLEYLDVSNNPNFKNENLFLSLQYKDKLKEVIITTSKENQVLGELKNLKIPKLSIVNSEVISLSENLKNIQSLGEISFDNTNFSDPKMAFESLEKLKSIQKITFKNSKISNELKQIKNINELIVSDVILDNDIDEDDFKNIQIINSVFQDSSKLLRPKNVASIFEMTDNMVNNAVEPLVEVKIKKSTIPADTPCEIKAESTTFTVPKNAFLNQNGQIYKGITSVEIKEYFDPISVALAGVPMVFKENSTAELFSSNGMFEFKALDSLGNELKPNQKNQIQVELKNLQADKNSDLFVYDKAKQNWERLETKPVVVSGKSFRAQILDSLNKLPDSIFAQFQVSSVPFSIIYSKPLRKKRKIKKELNHIKTFHIKTNRKSNSFYVNNNSFYDNESPLYFVRDEYLDYVNSGKIIIDTLLNPDLKDLFFEILSNNEKNIDASSSSNKYIFTPRAFSNLSINPDFENDRFEISFNYKSKEYRIPLLLQNNSKLKNLQKAQAKFYKNYKLNLKNQETEIDRAKSRFMKNEKEISNYQRELRAQQIEFSIKNPNPVYKELLSFGLSSFGLVNCDYLSRNKPNSYLALSQKAIDQNGNEIELSSNARNILLADNTYLETSIEKIPRFNANKSIIFFAISGVGIAVVKSWERLSNGKNRPTVNTFSTEGLTQEEIRTRILN